MSFPYILTLWLLSFVCLFADELSPIPLQIPMRDGKILTADLYLPNKDLKNLPCVLIRSPAGKQNPYALIHLPLLKEGYALVIQETRSSADKEGKTLPYESDGWGELQDGVDTLDFLVKSPYTNGQIVTVGASALGITQLLLSPTSPKGLKAQYIAFATSDLFNHGLYQGGDLHKHQVEGWLSLYAKDPSVYKTIYTQPFYNSFWEKFNMLPLAERCTTPTMHLGGWYDTFLKGTLEAFTELQNKGGQGAKNNQRLVIGPWTHLWPLVTDFGDFQYPAAANDPPFDFSPAKWFSRQLGGENSEYWPNVLYFVMGPFDGTASSGNIWKTASSWPIPSDSTSFYLSPDGKLVTDFTQEGKAFFRSDPNDPVPTLGGRNLFLPSGPIDQSPLLKRHDLLIFSSEPLLEDLEVTGNLTATLFVNTDREDSSFALRLIDIYPDGRHILIAEGITRFSSALKKDPLLLEGATPLAIDLLATSFVFAKDHRIGLIVAGSNYPKFEKNFNTLKRAHENPTPEIAKNTVFMGKSFPSHIQLPLVRQGVKNGD